jgi:hypothetical protein
MSKFVVNEFMSALEIGASIHADRESKRENKFASSYFLRDSAYLYLYIIPLYFFLIYDNILCFIFIFIDICNLC